LLHGIYFGSKSIAYRLKNNSRKTNLNLQFPQYSSSSIYISDIEAFEIEREASVGRMGLPLNQKLGYSFGHVLNDLTASVWFSYFIAYLHQVLNFNNTLAGYLMLIGQVSDALFTPIIGYKSDHTSGICGLGKRKSWYLVGKCT
jgi:hypothetical protein